MSDLSAVLSIMYNITNTMPVDLIFVAVVESSVLVLDKIGHFRYQVATLYPSYQITRCMSCQTSILCMV